MTATGTVQVVAGDEALAELRQGLTGARAFELLGAAAGRLLIQLPVGVGKTEWLVAIVLHALTVACEHDLVVVLLPRWDILQEVLQRLPKTLPRTVLYPRPRKRCGELDAEWQEYEQGGCAQLGRQQLCAGCPRRVGCAWPGQYGSHLKGARLVLSTQQHLVLNPHFVEQLRLLTGAHRPLVLLDESDLLLRPCERAVAQADLARFIGAQESLLAEAPEPSARVRAWLELSRLLTQAGEADLREGRWSFPRPDDAWAVDVQRRGRELYGPSFRFLGFDLRHFARSDPASRERLPDGGLRFAVPPSLGKEFIIFSGSIGGDHARYRLDPNHARPALVSPFAHHRFEHPATRWFNLAMPAGAARFFPGNSRVILDFFAFLIARNIAAGKRTLLVARKKFRRLCQSYLRKRLAEIGAGPVRIPTGRWGRHDLNDPRTLPLINYGVSGVNRFQHCEAAYCLTGYYVSAAALARAVHDLDPAADRYPVSIRCAGDPPRRRAEVHLPDGRETILPRVVSGTLLQKEADVVVQAVGRVRPFTRPREVITFHMGELPGVRYAAEFRTLAQARAFFGVPTASEAALQSRVEQAARLWALGRPQKAIAAEMNVSLSSVKRYLRQARGHGVSS